MTRPLRSLLATTACAWLLASGGLSVRVVKAEELPAPPPAPTPAAPPAATVAEPLAPRDRLYAGMQATYVWQHKFAMPAAYTLPATNSLQPFAETGYTLSATLFLGARPWRGGELFVHPEVIQTVNISGMHGLGGMSNSENQKGGREIPTVYVARAFLRQTLPLGGAAAPGEASPSQFADLTRSRRLVFTAGMMSLLDVFDVNPYAHDGRTQFANWALLTHGAYDFAADTRGYTWGIAGEYIHDAWAVRLGRYLVPKQSNGMALDFNLFSHYGDNLEVAHGHFLHGHAGMVRLIGFRNYEHQGAFAEAVASAAGATPTVADVRRDQSKVGLGLAVDQDLPAGGGVFLRASWNDGRTETYTYAEIERSLATGLSWRGAPWRRPTDAFGAAWVLNGLSRSHREYLAAGGLGFLIGDGQLRYGPEQIVELYYSALTFHQLWLTADFQHVTNPAYNRERGPANFLGVRLHVEM
jgi:high affinity Mn2+ porin